MIVKWLFVSKQIGMRKKWSRYITLFEWLTTKMLADSFDFLVYASIIN